jgi:hypothetical protein
LQSSSHGFEDDHDINLEIPIDDPTQVVLHKEMFLENNSSQRDVFIHEDHLDFSYCEAGRTSEVKTITITNKFNFEVDVKFSILQCATSAGEVVDNSYKVEPAEATIPANGEIELKVKFRPFEPDAYFF